MPDLPTGTVTFLFTDIEGSTALWEQHPTGARLALRRHDELVEQSVSQHEGVVVRPRGEGDSRFAVFPRASDAVAAAAALQQGLHGEPWSTPGLLRVRMALHTGEANLREGDYYGSAVNRCARLRAVAHGGQVLLSSTTRELVAHDLPDGVTLRDLGEHRLKDLLHPEHVFQLAIAELPSDFAPLTSLSAQPGAVRTNLPLQLTSFIGREHEVDAIQQRILDPQMRLLTLTGPGGTGKTRLALQVAAEVLGHFADGVWLVELAPIHDAALVGSAIAAALGVKESAAHSVSETLKHFLRDKRLLLVLDNFEQVLVAGSLVADLLQGAPSLKAFVTSRAALHLRGEHEVPVRPLSLPPPGHILDPVTLSQYAAVELFVQRARTVNADFVVNNATAPAVAEICVRLDGLPLAIELAAARSRMLGPQALLARLHNQLNLLTGGARDLPTRQQTLRGTIAWSFGLLEPNEQQFFTRLGVFAGGWTVEAAEAVCDADGDLGLDVLDGLQSLLDKSLLQQVEGADGEPHFRRLEAIREFAIERLAASGTAAALRERHARYYMAWLETLPRRYPREHRGTVKKRIIAEMSNLAAMAQWVVDENDLVLLMRWHDAIHWVGTLPNFGVRGVSWSRWHQRLIDSRETLSTAERAKALMGIGRTAWFDGDSRQATALLEEALALSRTLDDPHELLEVPAYLGDAYRDQDLYAQAAPLYEEYLALAQARGSQEAIASGYLMMGELALLQEDYARALALVQTSLLLYRETRVDWGIASTLINAGLAATHQGDTELAAQYFDEGVSVVRTNAMQPEYMLGCLIGFAALAASHGQAKRAARLLGATETRRDLDDLRLIHAHGREYERTVAVARSSLDTIAWNAAWAEGRAMTLEPAVAYALSNDA